MKLNKDNSLLSLSFSWQSAVSDIAFLLIIFFILTATFGLNRIIIFENNNSQQKIINAKDIVTICLKSDGTLFYNQKIVTNDKLKYFLNKKNNY
ncbi:MAG: biopolymer transporter ExbD, partial [Spirochaetes bacterium]|nr:biopolymer transporter ExbD [Spirochaetota bacterium]